MKKLNQKGNNGITLIALVITIIVLLILAGVAINMAIDSDGLFGKAREASERWNRSITEEEAVIKDIFSMLDNEEIDTGNNGNNDEEEPEYENIKLDSSELLLYPNTTETLTITVEPEGVEVPALTWTSSDPSVATVSDGVVTWVSTGETTITVKDAYDFSATCKVTSLFQFTINTVTYYAEKGMDWLEWSKSSYKGQYNTITTSNVNGELGFNDNHWVYDASGNQQYVSYPIVENEAYKYPTSRW